MKVIITPAGGGHLGELAKSIFFLNIKKLRLVTFFLMTIGAPNWAYVIILIMNTFKSIPIYQNNQGNFYKVLLCFKFFQGYCIVFAT